MSGAPAARPARSAAEVTISRYLVASVLLAAFAAIARADPPPRPAAPADRTAHVPAPTAPVATVRTGNHETFGRVVVDLPRGARAVAAPDGAGGVLVRLVGATFGAGGARPRNVAAISATADELRLTLVPGARFTTERLGTRLVIDISAEPAPAASGPPAKAAPSVTTPPPVPSSASPPPGLPLGPAARFRRPPHLFSGPPSRPAPPPVEAPATAAPPLDIAAGRPEPVRVPLQSLLGGNLPSVLRPPAAAPPPAAAEQPVGASPPPSTGMPSPAPAAETAPVTPVASAALPPPGAPAAGPVALAVQPVPGALQLPFAPTTGAAAFRRGGQFVVVFDEHRPLDLAALRDDKAVAAAFPDARVQLLPAATVLRLTLPGDTSLQLTRTADGWTLARLAAAPTLQPIRGDIAGGALHLGADAPGQVVSVPDPLTGGALLVGTQTQPGEGIPLARQTPDFTLLETLQGVAVEPVSDALTLHVAAPGQPPGFLLAADAGPARGTGVALDPMGPDEVAAMKAAHMTRRWDFPALPTAALLRRLEAASADAGGLAPDARLARRLQAVQIEIALGMGAEANALVTLAIADDARAAGSPDAAGLAAVAALLAGRPDDAGAIADKRLDGSDEVAFWRAVRLAMQREGAPEAAASFASAVPLLMAYPAALRDRLLPLVAETMVLGGERAAARRVLEARKDDAGLEFARGLLAELDGHAAPALAIYDRLAQSPDRRTRARAAVRAVDLRLRGGALTTAQAAEALDHLIYAWRGGPEELALRLRVAELQADAGNFRAALSLLRETGDSELAQNWPEQKPAIRKRMVEVLARALAGDSGAAMSPLDLVSLVDENPDLLPDGEAGRALAAQLAGRLVALDLPRRAAPVLEKLMNATAPGAAKAELGARLASVYLEQSDPTAALQALSASAATDLPPALEEARTIAFARATAARGAVGPATAALAALGTPAADEARAGLLERAKDWPAATAALASYVAKTVPAEGMLAAAARALLRLASDAAQARDEALLARLRDQDLARIPPGKTADLFRLLTAPPVQGVADLPRAAQEAALARALPAALKSLGTTAAPP